MVKAAKSGDKTTQDDRHDRRLWQELTKGVQPLKSKRSKIVSDPVRSRLAQEKQAKRTQRIDPALYHNSPKTAKLTANQLLHINKADAQKLRRGKMSIEGRLDLHGMTQDQAYEALMRFIEASYKMNRRCLLVITGKGLFRTGAGVLRKQMPGWLMQSQHAGKIIAITQSHHQHGGEGAFYVLLKRQR